MDAYCFCLWRFNAAQVCYLQSSWGGRLEKESAPTVKEASGNTNGNSNHKFKGIMRATMVDVYHQPISSIIHETTILPLR